MKVNRYICNTCVSQKVHCTLPFVSSCAATSSLAHVAASVGTTVADDVVAESAFVSPERVALSSFRSADAEEEIPEREEEISVAGMSNDPEKRWKGLLLAPGELHETLPVDGAPPALDETAAACLARCTRTFILSS